MSSSKSSKNSNPPSQLFSAGNYQKIGIDKFRAFQGNTRIEQLTISSGGYASIDGSNMPPGADKNQHGISIQKLNIGYGGAAFTSDTYIASLCVSNFGSAILHDTCIKDVIVKLGGSVRIESCCRDLGGIVNVTSSGSLTACIANMDIKARDGGVVTIGDRRNSYTDSGCTVEAMTGARVHVRDHTARVALYHGAWCEIYSGGDVHHGNIAYGGGFVVSNGGCLSSTSAASDGVIHCLSGGELSHVYVSSGATAILHDGCHVYDLHVYSGGELRFVNFSSGFLEDITVTEGGRMRTVREVFDFHESNSR